MFYSEGIFIETIVPFPFSLLMIISRSDHFYKILDDEVTKAVSLSASNLAAVITTCSPIILLTCSVVIPVPSSLTLINK